MFFAFAVLYPDTRFLIFFLIPVKVKWLAWIDAAYFAFQVLLSLLGGDILGALLPVIAILNFIVFFWTNITDEIAWRRGRAKHQISHQTIQFKAAAKQQKRREEERGYRRLRPHGYGVAGSGVSLLLPLPGIPLFLPGSYFRPCTFYGVMIGKRR